MEKFLFLILYSASFSAVALNEKPSLLPVAGRYSLETAYKGDCPTVLEIKVAKTEIELWDSSLNYLFFKFEAISQGVKTGSEKYLYTKSRARRYPSRLEITFQGTQEAGFYAGDFVKVSLYKNSLELHSGTFQNHSVFEGIDSLKNDRACVYNLPR